MKFACFCKSFRDDLERCKRLVETFEVHNRSNLPLFLSVPAADQQLFRDALGSHRCELLCDEDILGRRAKQSWHTQQLVKLEVFRTAFADAWLWFDSDSYFIRDFSLSDFVRSDGRIAFVASSFLHLLDTQWDAIHAYLADERSLPRLDDDRLRAQRGSAVQRLPWWTRLSDALTKPSYESRLPRIPAFFGRSGPGYYYLPGPIWTLDSLQSFQREVLDAHGLTFESLLAIAPWEGTWIGEWEIFRGLPGRYVSPSFLAHVSSDATILKARAAGTSEQKLATRYIGLQLAARHQELDRLDANGS